MTAVPSPSEDYVVLVDEANNVMGTKEKLAAHTSDTKLHRGFSVFLFNNQGELLLQQRSSRKKTWPLIWSNSVCGHPRLEESSIVAGRRRLKFELGITEAELYEILPTYRYRFEHKGIVENEICPVMVGFTNEKPVPNPDEVASYKWIPWQNFLTAINDPSNQFSEWCVEEANLLAKNEGFVALLRQYTKGEKTL